MLSDIITNVSEYTAWTETVAIYPRSDANRAREYEIFGLLSEIGEICGMLKRELRDPDYTLERLSLKLELGDVAWYLARIHYHHEHEPEDEDNRSVLRLLKRLEIQPENYGCFEVSRTIFEHFKDTAKSRNEVISYLLGKNVREIKSFEGLFETLKELEVDEESMMVGATLIVMCEMYSMSTAKLITMLIDNMSGTLGIIAFYILCDRFRFDPLEVMKANFTKLEDRKDRNKLHGKGDYR